MQTDEIKMCIKFLCSTHNPLYFNRFLLQNRILQKWLVLLSWSQSSSYIYLIQNSQAVKKQCGPQKGYGEKRCEIQGGGQEMAVMVG